MLRRLGATTLAVGLLAGACGSAAPTRAPAESSAPASTGQATSSQAPTGTGQPSSTEQPTTTRQPIPTSQPTATGGPTSTGEPPPDETAIVLNSPPPLPAPELESVDEIVQNFFEPGLEDQAVMSMLDQLGIAVYSDDATTTILAGSDHSDEDFYLHASEVRGLIGMLESAGEQPWIDFSDLYEGFVALGLQSSAEELARAYNDAYAAAPDEPITQFVQANAFISTDAQVSPLGVWLMMLDGMIPPNGLSEAMALTSGSMFVARGRAGWGAAQSNVQQLNWNNINQAIQQFGRAMEAQAMAQTAQITITTSPNKVHEGHGGPGAGATVTALVRPCGGSNPYNSSSCRVPPSASLAGFNVTWTLDGSLTAHGTASVNSGASTPTDAAGSAKFTYTPRAETPDAHLSGYLTNTVSTIQASVPRAQIIQQIYGLPANAALFLGGSGSATYSAPLLIEWHEPEALRIELVNPYDVTFPNVLGGNASQKGTDTIKGDLILDDDGVTYRGIMVGHAKGSFRGNFMGSSCSTSWDARQLLQVEATVSEALNKIRFNFTAVDPPSGVPRGRCRPTQWKSPLSGVYLAPYNDYAIAAGGLEFDLMPKPGGDADYPVPNGTGGVTIRNTLWHVHMEYLGQP